MGKRGENSVSAYFVEIYSHFGCLTKSEKKCKKVKKLQKKCEKVRFLNTFFTAENAEVAENLLDRINKDFRTRISHEDTKEKLVTEDSENSIIFNHL